MNWRDALKVHPAADVFPMLSANELRELAADIKQNGLRERVVTWQAESGDEYVLDGRNRLDALELAGFEVIEDGRLARRFHGGGPVGGDPTAYVISANIHRRHLTKKRKAELIVAAVKASHLDSANLARSRIRNGTGDKSLRGSTKDPVKDEALKAAAANGISTRTVERALSDAEPKPKPKPSKPKLIAVPDIQEVLYGLLDQQAAALAKLGRGSVQIKTIVTFSDGTRIERTTKA